MSAEEKKNKKDRKGPVIFAILGFLARLAGWLVCGLTIKADPRVLEWKKSGQGFVVLCAHPSEMDAVVLIAGCFPRYARFVVGAQQLYRGLQGLMLRTLGVIPKRQFTPDIASVKEMLRTVKDGHILAMMPEGRVSLDGRANPIDASTAKLLQKTGCPVAVMIPEGSFYTRPPYDHGAVIRGKLTGRLKALFEAGEASSLSAEEIMARLDAAIYYDAAEELRGSGRKYGSPFKAPMRGVSKLLYLCPSCGSLHTMSDSEGTVSCSSCGFTVFAGRDMFFHGTREEAKACVPSAGLSLKYGLPDCVTAWNELQLGHERSFWQDPEAFIEYEVIKKTMTIGKDMDFSGDIKGRLRLDHEGLHYADADESLDIKLSLLPGVSADYRDGFIACYQGDLIRRFCCGDLSVPARFVNSLMVLKGLR